ncbi:hypothetical protein MKP09_00235 [Niabella ginsengisoli]|uniref:Hybrid sensor histidine kinase/response regulator n=1 Tax=Niabella ginsengisoli TaxID=522298 RepID=A0ABS9SDN2_9BACT|nr:two-component regulator propeller domain-containing protein [Niabella ginsengisoli]MCH5596461.1 hypothetical protein [Niabella ginsengisoli]
MRERFFTFIILLFCCIFNVSGQSYYFTHYQVEDGLSNNAVLCILQDKLGFMWFGTRDGLNRFDGLSYKIFRNNPTDSNSIGSNAIISLDEAADKKIWVGTEKGLYIFNELTEKFTQLKGAGNGAIQSVKILGNDVFYINMYVLYSYNTLTKKITQYNFPNEVTSFILQNDNSLWIATATGLVAKYNKVSKSFDKTYNVFTKSKSIVSKWIQSLCDAGDGKLLVGTSNEGLKLLDTKNADYENLITHNADKTDITVMDILKTANDEYWVASQTGIYIININSRQYSYIRKSMKIHIRFLTILYNHFSKIVRVEYGPALTLEVLTISHNSKWLLKNTSLKRVALP